MAESYKRIYQGQLATPATPVYVVPSATQTIVKHMRIVNLDTVPRWVKMWQGGTADSNIILPQVSIPAGGWMEFDGVLTMEASSQLSAQVEVIERIISPSEVGRLNVVDPSPVPYEVPITPKSSG